MNIKSLLRLQTRIYPQPKCDTDPAIPSNWPASPNSWMVFVRESPMSMDDDW